MVKVDLRNIRITIEAFTQGGVSRVEVHGGYAGDNTFDFLVISGNTMILEGKKPMVIPFSAAYIHVQSPVDMIAEIVGEEVYTKGLLAIPEGKEREIVERLLVRPSSQESSSAKAEQLNISSRI